MAEHRGPVTAFRAAQRRVTFLQSLWSEIKGSDAGATAASIASAARRWRRPNPIRTPIRAATGRMSASMSHRPRQRIDRVYVTTVAAAARNPIETAPARRSAPAGTGRISGTAPGEHHRDQNNQHRRSARLLRVRRKLTTGQARPCAETMAVTASAMNNSTLARGCRGRAVRRRRWRCLSDGRDDGDDAVWMMAVRL